METNQAGGKIVVLTNSGDLQRVDTEEKSVRKSMTQLES
jgi:hypothetical protein